LRPTFDISSFALNALFPSTSSNLLTWNTFAPISEEYRDFVEPLIEASLPYDIQILIADLSKPEDSSLAGMLLDRVYASPVAIPDTPYLSVGFVEGL